MRLRAPGWPWLLAHEVRLSWRASKAGMVSMIVIVGLFWLGMHPVGWLLMRNAHAMLDGPVIYLVGGLTWFVLLLALALGFGFAVAALFERGDLDLLLSSPIAPRTVFTVRGLAVALQSIAFTGIFWLPFANGAIIRGDWWMLATYPVLASFGLGVAAAAFALTLALVRALGVRRAKVAAQVLGALAGAALFLISQAFNMASKDSQKAMIAWFRSDAVQEWLGPHSALWWPGRAVFGDPLPALAVIVLGCGAFVAVVVLCERLFLEGANEPVTHRVAPKPVDSGRSFQTGLSRVVIRKELLLLWRDPKLVSQTLLQVLYLLPTIFLLGRNGGKLEIMGPVVIVVAGTLAGNLGWMTMSGEEAPDLLGSAPVSRRAVLWLKVAAATLPALAICSPVFVIYAMESIGYAAAFAITLTGALAASAAVQAWNAKPGSVRDLKTRMQSSRFVNLLEFLGNAGWAGACYALMKGSPWFLVGVACGCLGPAGSYFARRVRDDV